VRAFGDPLFLKQTYGRGYQVNMFVDPDCIAETTALIEQVLPDATCVVDETANGIFVTVPKNNLMGLPRLFAWLEKSPRAAAVVKEWGVSNTTLEQVFLMLSAINTDTNVGNVNGDEMVLAKQNLCPMCRTRKKSVVFMRTMSSETMLLPDSLCWTCAERNSDFVVDEDTVQRTLSAEDDRDIEMARLLQAAQSRAEASATEHILALENGEEEGPGAFDSSHWESEDAPLLQGKGEMEEESAQSKKEHPHDAAHAPSSHHAGDAGSSAGTVAAGANGTMGAQVRHHVLICYVIH
jgi:hypothetical protein